MNRPEYLYSSEILNMAESFKKELEDLVISLEVRMTSAVGIPQYAALQSVETTLSSLELKFSKPELTYAKSHISSMLEDLKARLQPFKHLDALYAAMITRKSYMYMISWIQENILVPTQLNDFQPM